jgi:hypothetical protein
MYKKICIWLIALFALIHYQAQAQFPDTSFSNKTDTTHARCGLSSSYLAKLGVATGATTIPSGYPSSGIFSCGKWTIYYDDVAYSTGGGFNDGTYGATRRNTICAVLNYIESVYDFSGLPAGAIRLHVDSSYTHSYHTIDQQILGWGAPYYKTPLSAGTVVNGFVYDYVKSGTDPAAGSFHADLRINFDSIRTPEYEHYSTDVFYHSSTGWYYRSVSAVNFQSSLDSANACQYDLFTVGLHLISHGIGYLSLGATPALSSWDTSQRVGDPFGVYSLSYVHPSGGPGYYIWTDGSPNPNRSMLDNSTHLEIDHYFNNYFSGRYSMGDIQLHAVRLNFIEGLMTRYYSKNELQTGHNVIGYAYNPTSAFAASSPTAFYLNNHRPYCSKNYSLDYNNGYYDQYFYFDTVKSDFTVINNVGSTLTINLSADTSLHDADGDTIRYIPESLVNFRGCGQGGNNHNLLTLSNGNITITYTPRPNFYGRAQLGVNITDGKEKGAFLLYTIDVAKGNNVSVAAGANLVLNGDFEEGTEVKLKDTAEYVNNSAHDAAYNPEWGISGRIKKGTHFSDCHPYSNDVVIRNSYVECYNSSRLKHAFGAASSSFPWTWGYRFTQHYPDAYLGQGNRYQGMYFPDLFNLGDSVRKCHNYQLDFDIAKTDTISSFLTTIFDTIYIGFTDGSHLIKTMAIDAKMNQRYDSILTILHAPNWTHFSIPLGYCSDTPSNVLYIKVSGSNYSNRRFNVLNYVEPINNYAYVVLDNVVLKEIPYAVKIKDTTISPCVHQLTAKVTTINACSGTTYKWTTLSGKILGTTASIYVTPSTTTKYIVSANNGCQTAYDTISITGSSCPCSVGAVFGDTVAFYNISGTITSLPAMSYYYVSANTTINANLTIQNANVLIAPNVTITVSPNVKLTLDSAHLFTCPTDTKMWKGIVLSAGTGTNQSAQIELKNNSMVEDAYTAITSNGAAAFTTGNIIKTNKAIFNRNRTAIDIENYTATSSVAYPFSIVRTVFTSRTFSSAAFPMYPILWPTADTLKHYNSGFTVATPPFLIETYSMGNCKDGDIPYTGIRLNNVGYTNSTGTIFSEILIGDTTLYQNYNLFDNTGDGIYANHANLTSVYNWFMRMSRAPIYAIAGALPLPSGTGIYAMIPPTSGYKNRLQVLRSVPLINSSVENRFYDCRVGVSSNAYWRTNCIGNYFQTSNVSAYNSLTTAYGANITSPYFDSVNVNFNKMYNVANGVTVTLTNTSNIPGYFHGAISVASNYIKDLIPPPVVYDNRRYVRQGITVSNTVPSYVKGSYKGNILVKINAMDSVYNGIYLNGLFTSPATADINTIIMKDVVSSTGAAQFGIKVTNCTNAAITTNTIGSSSLKSTADKINGVYAAFNTNLKVCSNQTYNIGRSVNFDMITGQVGTRWILDSMYNGTKGMNLGSDIGVQATMTDYTGIRPRPYVAATGNKWSGFSSGYQTFVTGPVTTATGSILYVRNIPSGPAIELPLNNFAVPFANRYIYMSAIFPAQTVANCDGGKYNDRFTGVSTGTGTIKTLGMLIIADSLGYDATYRPNQWMNQLSLYQLGLSDSSLSDSFAIFNRFMLHAAPSRFGWITDMQSALASGDVITATALLGAAPPAMGRDVVDSEVVITDYSDADYVVANYSNYFNLYINYLNGTMSSGDSSSLNALTLLCPATNGAVVYQARSLYDLITGQTVGYDDDSCNITDSSRLYRIAKGLNDTKAQNYSLFPNPNEGSFVIHQAVADNKAITLKVYNAIGALVYQTNANFTNGSIQVNLGQKASGLYLVCIGDSKERTTCLRFIIK